MDFSPDAKFFGLVDSDGSLKIWDVENELLTLPDPHLTPQYTCLTWFSGLSAYAKYDASNDNQDWKDFVALGKLDGSVDLYSYTTGSVEYTLDDNGHLGAVAAICWGNYTLCTTANDHKITVWTWKNSQFKRSEIEAPGIPTAVISFSPDLLLVACEGENLWFLPIDGSTAEEEETSSVHSDVSSMKMLKQTDRNTVYVLTASKAGLDIKLWKINTLRKSGPKLLIKYSADFICCSVQGNKLLIAGIESNDGFSDIYIIGDIRKISETDNLKKSVKVGREPIGLNNDRAFVPIVLTKLKRSSRYNATIQIGYGCCSSLRFLEISPKYLNRTEHQFFYLEYDDPLPPIVEQNNHSIDDSTVAPICDTEIEELVKSMIKALDNFDASLLRAVICRDDEDLISSIVAQLPETSICKLVELLTSLIGRKTTNVRLVKHWLNALLQVHPNRLMTSQTQNNISDKLRKLQGAIDGRNKRVLRPLLELDGKLNLLLSQRNTMANNSAVDDHENVLVESRADNLTSDEEMDN